MIILENTEVKLMKKYKRFCALLITLLTVLTLLPFSVTAAGRIDKDAEVTLTVSCKDDGRPIKGTEFDIYLVADVEPSGELTITETFSEFNVDIRGENDSAWRALASTLEGYVLRDRITPTDTAVSDEDGNACFPSAGKTLKQGLYLVCGYRHSLIDHRYDPAPILVLLPARDKELNIWQYDVTVNAKFEITDVGGDEDDDPI